MKHEMMKRGARQALLIAATSSLIVACGDNHQQMDTQTAQADAEKTMPEENQKPMQMAREVTSFEDVQAEAADLTETLADYGADQRQEFAREVDQALGKVDNRIETIEMNAQRNWEVLSDAARQKSEAMLQELREKREAVAESYKRIQNDSNAAWDEVKAGFSRAWTDVVAAVENAEQEFDSEG